MTTRDHVSAALAAIARRDAVAARREIGAARRALGLYGEPQRTLDVAAHRKADSEDEALAARNLAECLALAAEAAELWTLASH